MAHKTLIGGTAYEIGGGKVLVGGTGYSIDKGRTKVGGTGYDISFGTPIGSLAVGSSVFFDVEGTPWEFIVVHQGNPDSAIYDESCDGTWLLMKNLFAMMTWNSSASNDYQNSSIHAHLNNENFGFLALLESDCLSAIKQVKIPYQNGTGSGGTLSIGSSGLSTKIFLLSGYEVGWTNKINSDLLADGACLDYFSGFADVDSKRIGYYNEIAKNWWLRTPAKDETQYMFITNTSGGVSQYRYYNSCGIRPALILPSDFDVTNYLS